MVWWKPASNPLRFRRREQGCMSGDARIPTYFELPK
jgi:hypothetical protein